MSVYRVYSTDFSLQKKGPGHLKKFKLKSMLKSAELFAVILLKFNICDLT